MVHLCPNGHIFYVNLIYLATTRKTCQWASSSDGSCTTTKTTTTTYLKWAVDRELRRIRHLRGLACKRWERRRERVAKRSTGGRASSNRGTCAAAAGSLRAAAPIPAYDSNLFNKGQDKKIVYNFKNHPAAWFEFARRWIFFLNCFFKNKFPLWITKPRHTHKTIRKLFFFFFF